MSKVGNQSSTSLATTLAWYQGSNTSLDVEQYCPTRDVFEGRLSKLPLAAQKKLRVTDGESFLLAAAVGEIGNNCFDHNLGHWESQPGIYFGYQFNDNHGVVWIADRGRGVYASLHAAHSHITDPQQALELAFEQKISGRFPEKRGNGLKFVRQIINCEEERGLWCRSGDAEVRFGKQAAAAENLSKSIRGFDCSGGTITILTWYKS